MKAVMVDERNADVFGRALGPAAEHVGREWCSALLIVNDTEDAPFAGILWELLYAEEQGRANEASIRWVKIWDAAAEEMLFAEYKKKVSEQEAAASSFELPLQEYESQKDALKRAGFAPAEAEGQMVAVTIADVMELSFLSKGSTPPYIGPLSDRSERSIRRGIGNCLYHGAMGLLTDCASIPTDWFELDISSYIETDGKISGIFLIHKDPEGVLIPQLMFAYGADYNKDLILLIRHSLKQARMIYPSGTKILLARHNKSTKALIEKLFPGHKGIAVLKGGRMEQ